MSLETKTCFPGHAEGIQFLFPPVIYPTQSTVKSVAEKSLQELVQENEALRAEIKALKGIIKNMNS